jgi:hypothetical protein
MEDVDSAPTAPTTTNLDPDPAATFIAVSKQTKTDDKARRAKEKEKNSLISSTTVPSLMFLSMKQLLFH